MTLKFYSKKLLTTVFIFISFCLHAADSNVRLNSIGFLPNNVKGVTSSMNGTTFTVVRVSDNTVMFTGNLGGAVAAADSGETVYKGDFSAFTTPGVYRVNVAGVGNSVNFTIADDVYNSSFVAVMRAMYLWRCNTAVSGNYGGDTFSHAACHMNDAYQDYSGGGHVIRNGQGGWHDAGDYNKYVVNAGITVGMMFSAWEHYSAKINSLPLGIPNTAPGYPDYLKELKYETDWLLKMAYPDGTGRVSAKLSALNFNAFEMPEAENEDRFFTDWGSAATADYVAMLAMAARVFYPYDPAYSQTCINAAWTSYNFLLANTANKNPDFSAFTTGGYGTTDPDDRLWAAAEMWATTGSTTAHQDFTTRANAFADKIDEDWGWTNVKNLGMYTYLLCTRTGKDAAIRADIQADLIADANAIVTKRNNHGYMRPLAANYYWGCNGSIAGTSMNLQIANMVSPNANYVNTALDAIGYLLGRNMHRRSYITGVGASPPMFPHDRRSGADGITNPWPGYLVGGSSGTRNDEWQTANMAAGLPAAQYWTDVEGSYSSNEIAINWQGAIIYALAGFIGSSGTPTFTPTFTRTATPTSTRTLTSTFTFTRTGTPTMTRTSTPVPPTATYTRTATPTFTRTVTPTFTGTNTAVPPTFTFTFTATATPTFTRTGTLTTTAINTSTFTRTGSPTYTRTATRTPTFTRTVTLTYTVTPSFTQPSTLTTTPSITVTWTGTPPSPTFTPTVTRTWTASPSDTVTRTDTATPTDTPLNTETATPTRTRTFTNTPVNTPTNTAVNTASNTPVNTFTNTPVNTSTSSVVPTATNTPVNTSTSSVVPTATNTLVNTLTNTPVSTVTLTATRTTLPATPIPTSTYTPVITATPDKFEIKNPVFFPNPYNPNTGGTVRFGCDLTQAASDITIRIYTSSFRAVREIKIQGLIPAGRADAAVQARELSRLGAGVYYFTVTAVSVNNLKAKAGPGVFVILK